MIRHASNNVMFYNLVIDQRFVWFLWNIYILDWISYSGKAVA